MSESNDDFIRNYELETWTRCSNSYEETFAMLTNQTIPALMEKAKIGSGSRVLDIGCGPGNSTKILSEIGADIIGIDFSQEMVDIASANYPNLTFKYADAESIPEDDDTFDVVIANYVVHHLPDPVKVFSEIARVLKPNGRFAFVVWGPAEEQSSFGAFFDAFMAHHELSELPHGPLYGVVDRESFVPLIEEGGLSNFELSKHETAWKCETLAPVIEGVWTWGNLAIFSQIKQDRIRRNMIQNCKPFSYGDGFIFPHSAVLGFAEKQ